MKNRKSGETVALIGNGFDLNHGYKTDYGSFVNAVRAPALDVFRALCEKYGETETWYDFENNVERLTLKLFRGSVSDGAEHESNRRESEALCGSFGRIHSLLAEYLAAETAKHPPKIQPALAKYLSPHTLALNFNYTDTASAYTDNVFFVHGSLKENDILLGYDYRAEPCLAGYEDMRWSKALCREMLRFRRALRSQGITPGSDLFRKRCDAMELYLAAANSARGLDGDAEPEKRIPEYSYAARFANTPDETSPDCSRAKRIIVLGHGIRADREYLRAVLENCAGLEEVAVFRHARESDAEHEEKKAFFAPYCGRIITEYFEN